MGTFLMAPFPAGVPDELQGLTPELSQVKPHGHQSHVTLLTTKACSSVGPVLPNYTQFCGFVGTFSPPEELSTLKSKGRVLQVPTPASSRPSNEEGSTPVRTAMGRGEFRGFNVI